MTDPLHTEPGVVTQADREATNTILKEAGVFSTSIFGTLAQAFARHRTAAEDEIAELREALGSLIAACDRGRTVPKPGMGACGMTIEAQTRASCINGVDAWAVEEARAALTGDRT